MTMPRDRIEPDLRVSDDAGYVEGRSFPEPHGEEEGHRQHIVGRGLSLASRFFTLDVAVVMFVALVLRLIHLDHPGFIDEYNHVLAARSWAESGTFSINGGAPYDRAWIFTILVAGAQSLFGVGLVAARLPAVLAGVLLAGAVAAGTRSMGGRGAGLLAGLLVAVDPDGIRLSQLARFYTLHALFFWAAAVALYLALERDRWRLLVPVALFLLGALNLQRTTIIGAGALAAGALVLLATRRAERPPLRLWILSGVALLAAAGLAWVTGFASDAWSLFRYADLWAEANRNNHFYYHGFLRDRYPLAWLGFPLLIAVGFLKHGRVALFLTAAFFVGLAAHSAAAWKTTRYIYYLMPLFFAVVAIGGWELLAWIAREIRRQASGFRVSVVGNALTAAALGSIVLWLVAGQPAFRYTARWMLPEGHPSRAGLPYALQTYPDWASTAERLLPEIERRDLVLLASDDVTALYHFGRLDAAVTVNGQRVHAGGREWGVSRKVAVPMITTPASIAEVMRCHPAGIVVASDDRWGRPPDVPDSAAEFVESVMEEIPLPDEWQVRAYRWEGRGEGPCPARARLRSSAGSHRSVPARPPPAAVAGRR